MCVDDDREPQQDCFHRPPSGPPRDIKKGLESPVFFAETRGCGFPCMGIREQEPTTCARDPTGTWKISSRNPCTRSRPCSISSAILFMKSPTPSSWMSCWVKALAEMYRVRQRSCCPVEKNCHTSEYKKHTPQPISPVIVQLSPSPFSPSQARARCALPSHCAHSTGNINQPFRKEE